MVSPGCRSAAIAACPSGDSHTRWAFRPACWRRARSRCLRSLASAIATPFLIRTRGVPRDDLIGAQALCWVLSVGFPAGKKVLDRLDDDIRRQACVQAASGTETTKDVGDLVHLGGVKPSHAHGQQ